MKFTIALTGIAMGALQTPVVAQAGWGNDSTWTDRAVVVTRHSTPQPILEWELVVPAPPDVVWEAWIDPTALATWASPAAVVDLRVGGTWEVHFNPERPPGERGSDANTIVGFTWGRDLWIEAGAPLEFPTVRAEKTLFRVEIQPVSSSHTLVRATQSGWKEGEEWERAFNYLAGANAEWLNWLHQRFVHGPIDWSIGPGMIPGGWQSADQ